MLFPGSGPLQQFAALGIRNFFSSTTPVLPNHQRIEVSGAEIDHCKTCFEKFYQRRTLKVIQVLRVNVAIACSQQSHRQRFHVRRQHETEAARFEDGTGLFEKSFRLDQMLDDGPKSNRIELSSATILL